MGLGNGSGKSSTHHPSNSVLGGRSEEKKIKNTIASRATRGYEHDNEEAIWQEDVITWSNLQNPMHRKLARILVFLRCIPEDRSDANTVNVSLRVLQWLSLLADMTAACVAIFTFNGVTYCCGEPILNFGKLHMPWERLIQVLTYLYLVLIMAEVYPVIERGIPLNLVNPFLGFIITIAMFFDDSKAEALIMWCIETFAVICEFGIYSFRSYQRNKLNAEVERLANLTIPKHKRNRRNSNESQVSDSEQQKYRQDFFRLKLEQKFTEKTFWYLRWGCYLNLVMVFSILVVIIFISKAGGLCIDGNKVPNLFDLEQLERCSACTEPDEECEVCEDGMRMCYYPYS